MKKIVLLFLFTVFVQTVSICQETASNKNVKVRKLSDHVYVFEEPEPYPANMVAITDPNGIVLLDTGFGKYANDLVETIGGLNSGNVKFIINSHTDGDHVGANDVFGTDVTVIGHKNGEQFFKRSGAKTITFDEDYSFKFDGIDIHCSACPGGHTSCDIIVHVPEFKIAYLGDIYLSQSFPRVDIRSGSKAQVLLRHLKKIYSLLPRETRVIPGHGRVTTMDEFKDYIEMVETTMNIIKDEMDKGKSLQEIQDADVLKDWNEWGTYFTVINKNSWINNVYLSYSGK